MKYFSLATTIAAPPERVWEVMSDLDRWPVWTPSVTSLKRLGEGAFVVGTRVEIRQPKLPRAIWTITAIDHGRSFTWVSGAPGLHVTGRHSIERLRDGSHVTLSLEYQGIFAGIMGRLIGKITEDYIAYEALGLKSQCENKSFRLG